MNSQNNPLKLMIENLRQHDDMFLIVIALLPSVFLTTSFERALVFGSILVVFIVIAFTLLKSVSNIIPDSIKLFVQLVIAVTLITVTHMLLEAFLPSAFDAIELGISLLLVNMVLMIKITNSDSSQTYVKHIKEITKFIFKVFLFVVLLGLLREFFGTGTIKIGYVLELPFQLDVFENLGLSNIALDIFVKSPGALLMIGFVLAFIQTVKRKGVKP